MAPTPTKPVELSRIVWFVLTGAIGFVLAMLFDTDTGNAFYKGFVWFFPYAVGAGLFCMYAPHLTELARDDDRATFTVYGFGGSFVVWGAVLGCIAGGLFGALQALVITIVLYQTTKSKLIIMGPLPFLVPAWYVASFVEAPLSKQYSTVGFLTLSTTAVIIWNALMFGLMAVIVHLMRNARAKRRAHDATLPCSNCGYSLLGLTADRCPECGTQYVTATLKPIDETTH
ncbi:MAG: hypothetical protein ACIAQ0_01610 [Phycisphaerales bacterium JB058]